MQNSINTHNSASAAQARRSGARSLVLAIAAGAERSSGLVARAAAVAAGLVTPFEFIEDLSAAEMLLFDGILSVHGRALDLAA